jgi:hypothetical protein
MNILQQNPMIFTSATCPTPYLVDAVKEKADSVSEFHAMDQDVLTESLAGYIKGGNNSWFESLTDKPVAISKSRYWHGHLNMLFHIYKNPKFILNLRDLRNIIGSYEKLLHKYPQWTVGTKEDPFHMMPFDRRLEVYFGDTSLGRPLASLRHIFEWMQRRPECFFVFRFEDFNEKPTECLKSLYEFLQLPYFEHDLNNIQQSEQYEHDTVYRAMVTHKTESTLKYLEPSWPKIMTSEQSARVVEHNTWFYKIFYPEVLK